MEGSVERTGPSIMEDEVSAANAAKQRQQQRIDTIRRAEESNAVRAEPLGQDRRYNRYWRFAAGSEAGSGRIFVELQVSTLYPRGRIPANPSLWIIPVAARLHFCALGK